MTKRRLYAACVYIAFVPWKCAVSAYAKNVAEEEDPLTNRLGIIHKTIHKTHILCV